MSAVPIGHCVKGHVERAREFQEIRAEHCEVIWMVIGTMQNRADFQIRTCSCVKNLEELGQGQKAWESSTCFFKTICSSDMLACGCVQSWRKRGRT